jgi:hypothetical protein
MAETVVVKSADAGPEASTGMVAPQVSHRITAVDITSPAMPLRMHTDGLLYPATAAAANASARIFGWSTRASKAGQTNTVYGVGAVFKYSDGNLTPGQILYLGETVGTLSSIATTGDAVGCAQAIDAYNIRITRNI